MSEPNVVIRKRLLVECPEVYRSLSPEPDEDFEYFGGEHFLKLWISSPEQYGAVRNYIDSSTSAVIRSLGTPLLAVRGYYYGIQLSLSSVSRKSIYDLIKILARNTSNPELTERQPIKVLDFALPEPQDEIDGRLAGIEPYTVRMVVMEQFESAGGSLEVSKQNWIDGGIKLRMEELGERYE